MARTITRPLTDSERTLAEGHVALACRIAGRSNEERLGYAHLALVFAARGYQEFAARQDAAVPFETYAAKFIRMNVFRSVVEDRGPAMPFCDLTADGHPAFEPAGEADSGPSGVDAKDRVGELLATLPAVEAAVVGRRFGIGGGAAMTAEEVGSELGLSRSDVHRIEVTAVTKMREVL